MREYNIIKKMKTHWDGINNKVFAMEKNDFKPFIIKNLRRKFDLIIVFDKKLLFGRVLTCISSFFNTLFSESC